VREAVVFFRERFVDRPFCITYLPHCIVSWRDIGSVFHSLREIWNGCSLATSLQLLRLLS
jgi:hypothetical protein